MAITVRTASKCCLKNFSENVIGEFYKELAPEYTEEYAKIIEMAQGIVKMEERTEIRLSGSGGA